MADGDGGIASASSAAVQKATPWSRSGFGYRIADIRRLGDPVDHIIFDGLDEVRAGSRESLREIVLLDVKTAGPGCRRFSAAFRPASTPVGCPPITSRPEANNR